MTETEISFPRQQARTRRFTLGMPRDFVVSPDGQRVLFLRSRSGSDPVTCLYAHEVATHDTQLLVEPATGNEELPPEEQARRERARETSGGVVRFTTDDAVLIAAFDLGGKLFTVDVKTHAISEIGVSGPAVDPRIDPTGRYLAYVANGALRVFTLASGEDRALATPEHEHVTYGLAEFVAAEEMGREAGFWWSPDGARILVARADVTRVATRYIADPANPETPPTQMAYPAAGGANADVELLLIDVAAGTRAEVVWDRAGFEYLVNVHWSEHSLLVAILSRDQREMQVLEVDAQTGESRTIRHDRDEEWVDIVEGVPARLSDGTLVWAADIEGFKRLVVGDQAVTPDGMQLRAVLGVDGDTVVLQASKDVCDPQAYTWSRERGLEQIGAGAGVSTATRRGGTTVLVAASLATPGRTVSIRRDADDDSDGDSDNDADEAVTEIESIAERPGIPRVTIKSYGSTKEIRTAVVLPKDHVPGSARLPVLMDPYGGPHGQRVLYSANAFAESQWFADQGFAVIVADGRGTPGHGHAWDRAVKGDLTLALEDQVVALRDAAAEYPDLDLTRVAIRGWSFGGYLAALAVLRQPDIFHAAVAGAPVADWTLYDTHYTERYLGCPAKNEVAYERSSLLHDALSRPLMIIHGLADDNVAVANTLRLSAALLAAGSMHTVLPLSGVTHMTPQEVVAENLLLLQLQFLQKALAPGS